MVTLLAHMWICVMKSFAWLLSHLMSIFMANFKFIMIIHIFKVALIGSLSFRFIDHLQQVFTILVVDWLHAWCEPRG